MAAVHLTGWWARVAAGIRHRRWIGGLLFAGALVAGFVLFDAFGSRHHTGVYPRWNDQVQYLGEAYTAFEYARAHGLPRGLWQALVNPSAQGTLHDVAALVLFAFTGPSRSAALAVNMLALIAWQVALFAAIARWTGSRWLACAVAMLPLALRGPWEAAPGSAYDFRLDHLAMCALGITSATAVLADGFRSRRGAIGFGVAVGATLLTRFLTGTYFVVIFGGGVIWIALGRDRQTRLLNLARSAIIAAVLAAPIFWLNRDWVWNYYYIGHYVGPESAIRDPQYGLWQSVTFVENALRLHHLGGFFVTVAILGALAFFWARGEVRPRTDKSSVTIVGLLFLLAPALVLTLHRQKSDVVVSALVPGVVLLVAAAWVAATRQSGRRFAVASVAALLALSCFGFFAQRQLHRPYDAEALATFRQINVLADHVFTRTREAGIERAHVATDNITDCLDGQVLRVICYERHHVWMPFEMSLPISIAEPDTAEVMQRLDASHFVFLSADGAPVGPYPYDRKLAALRPQLRAWCQEHLQPAMEFTLWGQRGVLYERREIALP